MLTRHAKRVALIIAGVFVLLFGLALSIPGVPGPGFVFVFLGLWLMGAEHVFINAVTWFFNLIRLPSVGAKVAHALQKISLKYRNSDNSK